MLESVHIVLNILIVVVGVGEKVVAMAEDIRRGDVTAGKEDFGRVFDFENLLGIVVEQTSLFVAQVYTDTGIALDPDRVVDANGTVVCGDDDIHILAHQSFEDFGQRRMLKPAQRYRTIGLLVVGKLANNIGVGAGVGKHVYKVVDNDIEFVLHQIGDVFNQLAPIVDVEHLVVAVLDIEAVATQIFIEQFVLELILETLLVLINPILGIFPFNLRRHESAKHRVASELGGSGDNAVVEVILLGAEVLLDGGLDILPLVVAEIVDYNEECGTFVMQQGKQLLADMRGLSVVEVVLVSQSM